MLEDGTPADDSMVKICRETYDKDLGDVNLGKERAAFLVDRFGSQRWPSVVCHVAKEALGIAASCSATQTRLSSARDASTEFFARRKAVLQAMSSRGDRQAAEACSETEDLSDLVDALLDGLRVSVDSIGMYYISPVPIEQNWGDEL